MIGDRQPEELRPFHYPVSEVAARYGASVPEATNEPDAAYADLDSNWTPVDVDWPPT